MATEFHRVKRKELIRDVVTFLAARPEKNHSMFDFWIQLGKFHTKQYYKANYGMKPRSVVELFPQLITIRSGFIQLLEFDPNDLDYMIEYCENVSAKEQDQQVEKSRGKMNK